MSRVLARAGVLQDRRATAFPGALDFALELVEVLEGEIRHREVEKGLVR